MKKSILFIALLAITTMAYPQTRRTRSESNGSNAKQENPAKNNNSGNNSAARSGSSNVSASPNKNSNVRSAPANTGNRDRKQVGSSSNENKSTSGARLSNSNPENRSNGINNRSATETRSRSTVTPSNGNSSRTSEVNRSSSRTTTPSREASKSNVRSRTVTSNNSRRTTSREASSTNTVNINKTVVVQSPITVRETRVVHHNHYVYRPIEYRRVHYVYRAPLTVNIVWTNRIYHDFLWCYPHHHHYININFGRNKRINTISAYDASFHVGEVMRVYGEVNEIYYSDRDDIYYLYIGGPYPYHDFSVVIQGQDYRKQRFPDLFRLEGRHIWTLGLITEFEGKPEVMIRKPYQLDVY